MKRSPTWPIVIGVAIVAVVVGIAIGGNEQKEIDPDKVRISGNVETVTPETKPVRLDFIRDGSNDKLSATVNENSEYSIQLEPGKYRVELTHTTIGNIVSPLPGFCGTYQIDSNDDNKDIKC